MSIARSRSEKKRHVCALQVHAKTACRRVVMGDRVVRRNRAISVVLRWQLREFPDEVDVVGFVFEQHGVHGIG
jgi:hypothetical protein